MKTAYLHSYSKTIIMRYCFTLLLIAASIIGWGHPQDLSKIAGAVKDKAGQGMLAANVLVLKSNDSSLVKGGITDADGKFEIELIDGGSYLVKASLLGYNNAYSAPFSIAKGGSITIPTLTLTEETKQLKEVSISSKKPMIEAKADKIVFNVESSINATGSNAMELLRKSPGVVVDNNENIALKGKNGVKIYIDGKKTELGQQDLVAYLKSINSSDIEAIEMISNPSAKYDASGNAGIINIKLKKNKKIGTNGNASFSYIQGITAKENASLSLNYRNKKVNVFGNFSGDNGINQNTMNINRLQFDTLFDQHSVNKHDNTGVNAKAGVDYFINSKNTIGVLLTNNIVSATMNSISNTDISTPTGTMVRKLLAYNRIPMSRTNNNANLNYRYTDTFGRELSVDADYGLYRGRGSSLQPNYYTLPDNMPLYSVINKNYTPTNIDIYTAKADYEQKMGKGKVGLGGKIANVTTANTYNFYNVISDVPVMALDKSNSFKYTEQVSAAYLNYNTQLNTKWSLQAGVRMENTASKGELTRADGKSQTDDTVVKNYTDFFPSAAITYVMNKKNTFNVTYSRRIDRPTYQDLNPFENKLDELTYEKGNAFLKPQYTQTVELTHTFMDFFNTTLGYSYVTDFATQITDTLGNANYVQMRNLATQQIYNLTVSAPIPIAKICTGYVNLNYNYQIFEGKIGTTPLKVEIPGYNIYGMFNFTLKKGYSAELSGWYSGPSIWGGTWRTKPQGGIDLGVQRVFWNNNATIKVSFTDILYTMPWKADNNFGGVIMHGSGAWESQTARLSFSYKFGSNQIAGHKNRKTGMEDEGSRIKGK